VKLVVSITYRLELTLDDRVEKGDVEWAILKAFDTSDGRQPFSAEMANNGVHDLGRTIAETTRDAMIHRIAEKYPSASIGRLNVIPNGWSMLDRCFTQRPEIYFTPYQTRVRVERADPDDDSVTLFDDVVG
jgi:hypothetical protein